MEEWRDIKNFPGYQVSNEGRVRSFWKKKHYPTGYGTHRVLSDDPTILHGSDDGNGYLKLMLYSKTDGKKYCKKIHRLVAEAFIPHNDEEDTVDHIKSGREGKLDNSVRNLRWVSRRENIQKAYRDGMCDSRIEKQKKPIMVRDIWVDQRKLFSSINDACYELGLTRDQINSALHRGQEIVDHYEIWFATGEDVLLYGGDYQCLSWV